MCERDELRRAERLGVCCRVEVRDRWGLWTAVTEDLCDRGCRVVAGKLPRIGSRLQMTLSSDLIPESLEVIGRTTWVSSNRIGVAFLESAGRGLTPTQWVARLLEHAEVVGRGPHARSSPRMIPAIRRAEHRPEDEVVVRLPVTRR